MVPAPNTPSNFQRIGSTSNAHVGTAFERVAAAALQAQGVVVAPSFALPIGVEDVKKNHRFDLGSEKSRVIVECKSHRWATGGNVPSAKIIVWNEAMYYFALSPPDYRRILFVLRDHSPRHNMTLAAYYMSRFGHLIPANTEIWEYDETAATVTILGPLTNPIRRDS